MRAMAKLRPHVDAFFDKVTVNVAKARQGEAAREPAQAAQRNPRSKGASARGRRGGGKMKLLPKIELLKA
jgi:hypothetical protein